MTNIFKSISKATLVGVISILTSSAEASAADYYPEPIYFNVKHKTTGKEHPFTIQQMWTRDMSEVVVYDQQHTVANEDGIIYIPQQEYNQLKSIEIRRFEASSGDELPIVTLNWTEDQLKVLNDNYASGYICLTNDQAGNILITFDCAYSADPGTIDYPLIIGRLNTRDLSIENMKTIYLDASNYVYWRCIGVPGLIGDITSDNFTALFPVSLSSTKLGGSPFTAVVKIDATINDGDVIKISGIEADGGNYYGCIMDAVEFVDDKVFFLDSNGRKPYMFICREDGFNEIASFPNHEATSSSAKGVKAFNIGEIRFLITGNETDGIPGFNLYSWQDELPVSEWEINWDDDFYFSSLTKHMTLGADAATTISTKTESSTKSISDGAETWHVVSIANNTIYAGTKDIVLYYPGGYMTSYRLGPTERFTGSSPLTFSDDSTENAVEYYTIFGIRLNSRPSQPGIYIKKSNSSAEKIVIN